MQEKNSFILYTDQKEVVDKLTDEQAGKLMKALYQYSENGTMPELDTLLEIAIIPIKQSIDKNNEKWEEERQKRSEAGRLGGLKKAKNQQASSDAKQSQAMLSNAKECQAELSNAKECLANQAVYVNVSDNVIKEKIDKKESPKKTFVKPTVDEVRTYCRERRNNVNAENFINFYESKGWKVGNTPMKDWKACVRTWEQRDKSNKTGWELIE
jgi:hypothetical protein